MSTLTSMRLYSMLLVFSVQHRILVNELNMTS